MPQSPAGATELTPPPGASAAAPTPPRRGRHGLPRRRARRTIYPWVILLSGWLVAAGVMVLALVFVALGGPLQAEAREREAVRVTASALAQHLTTFEGAAIDDWLAATQAQATPAYAAEVEELFDAELRATLRGSDTRAEGELVDVFVQSIGEEQASAFAVVHQTVVNDRLDEPVEETLRMEISLRQGERGWLAAGVEVMPAPRRPDLPVPALDADAGDEPGDAAS